MVGAENPRERSRYNQRFHFRLYEAARMPTLLAIIETVWVTIGPLNYYVFDRSKEFFWRQRQTVRPGADPSSRRGCSPACASRTRDRLREAIERDINEAAQISLDSLRSA